MTPDLAFWGRLLGVLTLELALVLAAVALVAHWTRAPQLRRSLWQAGLVACALIVAVECAGLRSLVGLLMPVTYQPPERRLITTVRPVFDTKPAPSFSAQDLPVPDSVAPILALPAIQAAVWWPGYLWLLGAGLLGLRALALRGWLARERRRAEPGDTETRSTIARLQGPLGLRQVELRVWSRLRGPVAFGTWWPTIAVPADFATRFTPAQREAMLAHELAHLAGRDPFWLAVADAVCALVWWHPAVWWARHQLRAASEEAADEASALVPEGVTALAESLVVFGRELATPGPARSLGVAGSGFRSELGRRVTALLDAEPVWRPLGAGQRWRMRLVALGGVAVVAALPWPGTGVLGLVVQRADAQSQNPELVSPTREEIAAMDRRMVIKDYRVNRVRLTGTSTTPLITPKVSLEEQPKETWAVIPLAGPRDESQRRVESGAGFSSNLAAPPMLSLPKMFTEAVEYPFDPQPFQTEAARPAGSVTDSPSGAVLGGLWAASGAGFQRVLIRPDLDPETGRYNVATHLPPRLVSALREAGVTVEPEVPPRSAANPPVAKTGASPAEPPGITTTNGLYTRTFRLPNPVTFLTAIRQTPGVTPSTNVTADVRQFFALFGLEFLQPPADGTPNQSAKAIFFNDRNGLLFVRATLTDLDRMLTLISALNSEEVSDDGAAGPEVTLRVQLAEVPVGSSDDLGLDWLFGLSPTNNPVTETTRPNPKAGTRVDTLTSKGEWVTLKAPQFDALRRSLKARNGTNLMSALEVTTRSGRQAQVMATDVRTIVTGVNAAVDPQTKAVGFDDVSISPTNTQPGINYQTEVIPTGPEVDIIPYAENEGWRLIVIARMTEFVGYLDPGKGNEPFVQAPGAKPLKATKPLAWLRLREMVADAFAKPGETVALRGAMVSRTNITRTGNWLVRRSYTNVVTQRLYAFITPQFTPAPPVGARASAPAVQLLIVRVMANDPGIHLGDRVVSEADLPAALKTAFAAKPNLRLLIRNDADPADRRLVAVRNAARQAGIPNIFLGSTPAEP